MTFKLVQISDTHLSPGKAHFTDNWAPLAHWIAEQRPDLVIHTGDVTVDGA
ncbi:MAG TPA: metallophosphoesterase, partial [Pseudolabrys sp.]